MIAQTIVRISEISDLKVPMSLRNLLEKVQILAQETNEEPMDNSFKRVYQLCIQNRLQLAFALCKSVFASCQNKVELALRCSEDAVRQYKKLVKGVTMKKKYQKLSLHEVYLMLALAQLAHHQGLLNKTRERKANLLAGLKLLLKTGPTCLRDCNHNLTAILDQEMSDIEDADDDDYEDVLIFKPNLDESLSEALSSVAISPKPEFTQSISLNLLVAMFLHNLANCFITEKDYQPAFILLIESMKIKRKCCGQDSIEWANSAQNLGLALGQSGKYNEMLRFLQIAMSIFVKKAQEDDRQRIMCEFNLLQAQAAVLVTRKSLNKTMYKTQLGHVLKKIQAKFGPSHPFTQKAVNAWARL